MRFYLDTNILIFMWNGEADCIGKDIFSLLKEYDNTLCSSTICVQELIHLCQIKKLSGKKNNAAFPIEAKTVFEWLDFAGIQIMPVNEKHLKKYAALPLYENHRDPNDRLIISQAISDKIPLISSDHKFEQYKKDGLDFIFNER